MTSFQQMWLVASRELRERSRSRAFLASLIVMVVLVVASIAAPAILDNRDEAKRVGLTGEFSPSLAAVVEAQGGATGIMTDIRLYPSTEKGETAVRDGDIDLLIVDGSRLEWQRRIDEELRVVAASAIQSLTIRERAAEAGIDSGALRSVLSPVKITDVKLGEVAGRTPDDETATFIMTVLLFVALSSYGTMVLTGVVEEKASRVVEVLLARMPARNLLAGKIAGIGLLGVGQFALTALAALVAVSLVDSFDVPAVRGSVLAWLVVWFVLGFALRNGVRSAGVTRLAHRGHADRRRPHHDRHGSRLLRLVRDDRKSRHHVGSIGFVLSRDGATSDAGPHGDERARVVGTCPSVGHHSGRDRRPDPPRRSCLHQRHPALGPYAEATRCVARVPSRWGASSGRDW